MADEKIITRYPPSPTGSLHIGNIRTLLFNHLFTRKHGGEIYLRFEDTDKERSKREHEAFTLDTLEALGLDYDYGPFRQSERTEQYVAALQKLIAQDLAYIAEESAGEAGENVVRFRNPNKKVTFTDVIRGEITIDTTDFGDFVIARSETSPVYHLSVVVDDLEMGVTHVIRGEDHITSTPRQILLIEALGGTIPTYAHLPLIVGPDKKKLGKRHGAVTYREFRELGYVPDAIVNYLALLGWNPGDDRELFTHTELIQEFSLSRVNNSPATFSYEKLDSINRHYLLQMPAETFKQEVTRFLEQHDTGKAITTHPAYDALITDVIRERIHKFAEVTDMLEAGEFDWLLDDPTYPDSTAIVWKKSTPEEAKNHLEYALKTLENASKWDSESLKGVLWTYAEEHGKGDVLWPIRFALTGKERSPDPFTVAGLIGKEATLTRLQKAVTAL